MNTNEPRSKDREMDAEATQSVRRRNFLALGAGVGATLLAGCATEAGPADGGEDGTGTPSGSSTGSAGSGTFSLLISDQPVAIDDFDELNVSFDRARIFRADSADEDEDAEDEEAGETVTDAEETETDAEETETDAEETETDAEETETDAEAEEEETEEEETEEEETEEEETEEEEAEEEDEGAGDGEGTDEDGQRDFSVVDLGGATVDLTQVVGQKAVRVFDGELPEGRYSKIELYATDVEGIVDGEVVDVKIPSGKLQIVKPFEVAADEQLRFVFDINVVKKGQTGDYNLLPVISESGVAGEDVEVEEVDNGDRGPGGEDDDRGTDENEGDDSGEDEEGEEGEEDEEGEGNDSEVSEEADTDEAEEGDDRGNGGNGDGEGPPDETEEGS